jgi:hypothetical protein
MRPLLTAMAGVAAALALTACGASAHHANRPAAGQCAPGEKAIRQAALVTSHFTGVSTARGLAAAFRQLARDGVLSGSARSYLVAVKSPVLSHELQLVEPITRPSGPRPGTSSHGHKLSLPPRRKRCAISARSGRLARGNERRFESCRGALVRDINSNTLTILTRRSPGFCDLRLRNGAAMFAPVRSPNGHRFCFGAGHGTERYRLMRPLLRSAR